MIGEPEANGKRQSFMHSMLMEWSDSTEKDPIN